MAARPERLQGQQLQIEALREQLREEKTARERAEVMVALKSIEAKVDKERRDREQMVKALVEKQRTEQRLSAMQRTISELRGELKERDLRSELKERDLRAELRNSSPCSRFIISR